tara:strand:- start:176 stop:790 length:615 start_codon:yes stop_codon:yes gene_type:complete
MNLVKEITSDDRDSVDGGALYFNPVIYDYAKENNIPLYELLRSLQDEEIFWNYYGADREGESLRKDWTKVLEKKWFSPNGIGEAGDEPFAEFDYRKLLVMDMFGLTDDEAENYPTTGAGLPDDVLFKTLSEFDERKIKSPLDMKDVGLWDGYFQEGSDGEHMFFRYESDEEGWWFISPFIFGYAKSFERRHLLMNYNELPRSGK